MLLSLVEERLIQKLGHTVVGKTGSAEEAVKKVEELDPDIIIMDIVLKGEMDGIDAMQEIRKTSEVPVIYLSGNSDRFNYERARKTDFTDYLVKPITSNDLKAPLLKAFGENGEEEITDHSLSRSKRSQLNKTA